MINSRRFKEYLASSEFLAPLGIEEGSQLRFEPLGQGEYNINYLFTHPATGKKLVLRINTQSQIHLDDQIGYEFSALKNLIPSGRTPIPVFCEPRKTLIPYGILVMEWLPGRHLIYERDMERAAEILADIHSVPVPENCRLMRPGAPARAIYEECLEMAEHYLTWRDARDEVKGLIRELIREIGGLPLSEASAAPICIVNTELNSGNFLITEDGGFLVDWEKPLLSEPAQDLGHFLAPTTTFWKTDTILAPEQVKDFAARYCAAVGDRLDCSTLGERLPLFFTVTCLRGVTWCAMALREYSQPDRPLANADTFSKIKAYMQPEFLKNILENYVRRDFLR